MKSSDYFRIKFFPIFRMLTYQLTRIFSSLYGLSCFLHPYLKLMEVLFFAFANSQSSPLPNLSREDDTVYSMLVNRYLKGHFIIHRDSFTSIEKINKHLGQYNNQISIFHYSGHADGEGLHLDDEKANALGVALQLGACAKDGNLKIVVLNGCSTGPQVKDLLEAGVPVVIATSAPVGDASATEFSIRFYRNLSEKRMTIEDAFEDALGPALTASKSPFSREKIARGQLKPFLPTEEESLWGLFYSDPEMVNTNPIPTGRKTVQATDFEPNEILTASLFEALYQAKNREIRNLYEDEEAGEYVEIGDKQTKIVNVLPFPISTHLQKLLCPIGDDSGYDKVSVARIHQIGTVFQSSVTFIYIILISQVWEELMNGRISQLPDALVQLLKTNFSLSENDRASYNYLDNFRGILDFLNPQSEEKDLSFFVDEFKELSVLLEADHPFSKACEYLAYLRKKSLAKQIDEQDIYELCEESEQKLADFLKELAYLHRYTLTSVQNIDIQKYRHQKEATFNHVLVKLMRAFGKSEQLFYMLPDFLDNRGVALIKGKVKVVNPKKREFIANELKFLNLSPFIIDRNAFEENTDLTNLLYFQAAKSDNSYLYQSVKRPGSKLDEIVVEKGSVFSAVHDQLEKYKENILQEPSAAN